MYAMGWTVPMVRDGLLTLAAEDRDDVPGLESIDVSRWLRGEHRPRAWMQTLCRLFRCHQTRLGWPPQGNEIPVDLSDVDAILTGPAEGSEPRPARAVFIQYLNPEILHLYGVGMRFDAARVLRVAHLLSRYAVLVSEGPLVMPASYLFEVPFILEFMQQLEPLRDAGLLAFASPSPDLGQYLPAKRYEYRSEESMFPGYFHRPGHSSVDAASLLWVPRAQRTHDRKSTR